ncbi:DDE-type integrase/transposase/recombinase (plasmid) [Qingshengfaniella alkalisoli]|uniref:DDE-type integrase/transposase/recombinase n=1 Tax=Qingshengfaniella alkalisoli TaxID=2599296 RepID=A0A5B8J0G9_9RHOB|nr:DDE-type integrase/transposase/recombinase [Qingshengfaniella alkalisoli]
MLPSCEVLDAAAARRFFRRGIEANGPPEKVVIDKSGANLAGLLATNVVHKITVSAPLVDILQVKFLNNIIEQDHRFIKRITRLMLGFKSFEAAQATLKGIEAAHMIRKGQVGNAGDCPFRVFADLAA